MQNALTERLGLQCPLIQAPMAGVSTAEMAAAVSNAGALGSVALGALGPNAAREALRATRALTCGPIAANVFTHPTPRRDPELEANFLHALAPLFEQAGGRPPTALTEIYTSFNDDDAMLEVLLDERPDVVSVHFGPAAPGRMQALHGADIFVIATATSVAEADALERAGVDAVVAQGFDAGGHSGAFLSEPDSTTAGRDGLIGLVRNVVGAVRVPVIAAGGLMSGQDVRAVIEAGASAAQLGTAFLACSESTASAAYRQRLMQGGETRLTSLISGRPARGLVNPLIRALEGVSLQVPDYPIAYDAVKQLVSATADSDFSVMWAGAGTGRLRSMDAAGLIAALRRELA